MAKGKGRINSSDGSAPPPSRSLRARKRESPSDELSQTDCAQAAPHQQDTEENNTAVVATVLHHAQSSLQECTIIANKQAQAAGQACLPKQDDSREENHAEEINLYFTKNVMTEAFEGQEESTVSSPSKDCELESFIAQIDNDTNKHGMEEVTPQEDIRSPSQTCTDQLQVPFPPTSEEGDRSCATTLEKQLGAKENPPCNLERNHETSQEEPGNMCIADVKEVTREAAVGLPAIKKRRMGMCGLTKKERSHFLQTRRCETGQSGAKRGEIMSSRSLPSSPLSFLVDGIAEQSEAEIKLQPSHCGGDDRAEAEVHVAVATSDGPGTMCDPGCSEGKSCEAEAGTGPGAAQTGEPESDPPVQDEAEECLENLEGRALEEGAAEVMAEIPEKRRKDGECGSPEAVCNPATGLHNNPAGNEGAEAKGDVSEAASPQEHRVKQETRVQRKEDMMADAGAGAEGTSSTITRPGGSSCGSAGLREAAATPTGSGGKASCDRDDEPGPVTVEAEHTQTREPTDPFGPGCLDYVSDSQLNMIALAEEVVMEGEEDSGSSDHHEDATDLISGLIRELSYINRTVMAAYRELENLRRGSKTPRSSSR